MVYRRLKDADLVIIRGSGTYSDAVANFKAKRRKPITLRTFNKYHGVKANKVHHKASKLTTPDTPEVIYRDLDTGKFIEHEADLKLGMTFAEYRLNRKGSATLQLVYDRKGGAH
jgi:hypothetical protein